MDNQKNPNIFHPVCRKNLITDPDKLLSLLHLDPVNKIAIGKLSEVLRRRPFRIPSDLIERMVPSTCDDPLLLQFLPRQEELLTPPGFSDDPLHETDSPEDGESFLLQKYFGRALILTTEYCAASCRYCFRRGQSEKRALFIDPHEYPQDKIDRCVHLLNSDSNISEIILSGGDPLSLDNAPLRRLLTDLTAVSHLKRIRIHTRLPILVPNRIDDEIFDVFKNFLPDRFTFFLVFQINHPSEINSEVRQILRRIQKAGIPMFSQTVLLRGINDTADVLSDLFELLGNTGVIPYYLHQLDRVAGSAHFEVPEERGKEIREDLRKRLPGYLVPKYVREIPGYPYKKEF